MRRYAAAGEVRPGAALVLAPGAGAGQTHPFMVAIATAIAAHGVDVFTFDFPYVVAGRRRPDPPRVLEEAWIAAIASVRGRIGPSCRLFIGGKSMGGRLATHVAARDDPGGDSFSGVVCLGYPLHPPSRALARPLDHFSQIRVPVLVLQGTRDAFGGPDELRRAVATTVANVDVVPLVDADHGFAVPRRSGRTAEQVIGVVAETVVAWIERVANAAEEPS